MAKNIVKHGNAVRVGTLAMAPTPSTNGTIYYNTSDNLFKIYENSQWQNIASRSYVDSVAAGFDPKESVEAATLGDISLSPAPATIDGVTLAANDRVLVRAQTDKSENGIYKLESGNLIRTVDFDDGIEVNGGEYVFVKGGNVYAGTAWVVTSPDGAATMGLSEIEWTQVSGAGKSLQNAYVFGATITTTSDKGPVIIEGTQSLSITASGGLAVTSSASVDQGLYVGYNASVGTHLYVGTSASVTQSLNVGSSLVVGSTASVTGAIAVGSGGFTVSSSGNITSINNVSYSFPVSQASGSAYALLNNGSGGLYWENFSSDVLNDFSLSNLQDGQLIRYDSATGKWSNESPVSTSGSAYSVVTTNASGYLDTSFLQYNVDLGDNVLSGVADPIVSSDAANKAFVDRLTLQIIYDQDANGGDATINTNSVDGAVVIAGSEKLSVTADGGAEIRGLFTAGSSKFTVSASGDLTKINNVSYTFPSMQAASQNYALVNDGSGNLSWNTLELSGLSDVSLTSLADNQLLRYDSVSSSWKNEAAISTSSGSMDAGKILMSDASGRLDTSFLQYNINMGGFAISNVGEPSAASDVASKNYVDTSSLGITLQKAYNQDLDGSDAIITTNGSDGSLVIAGSESLKVTAVGGLLVSAASGFKLASALSQSRYVELHYKDALVLSGSSSDVALAALSYAAATYSGCVVSYNIKDDGTGRNRVGTILLSNTEATVSIGDSFVETDDVGVSWTAAIDSGNVQVLYTTGSGSKSMNAEVKRFLV